MISFTSNFYIEQDLYEVFSKIKTKDIRSLEYDTNKNFYKYGIENMGENLRQELLEMKIEECKLNVRKDLFYIFQDKVMYVESDERCLMIKVGYHVYESVFYIRGFQKI